ncbi:P-loop containing nucleoside triphosphate hydrolase protein [Cladochytrium replicatum]|nr:P-loop containing nucleoside triphosphate hydrolase protein [Cladochytrium replicatum]
MKKVVIIGSAGSGKTALIQRLVSNTFSPEYQQTFGADLTVKVISDRFDAQRMTFHLWCCGGHERYRALLEQFYKDAYAALICFDMLSTTSFQEVSFWYNEMRRVAPDATVILVGTKFDDADNIAVKVPDAVKLAKEWGAAFKTVSSKTGNNVNELFQDLLPQRN